MRIGIAFILSLYCFGCSNPNEKSIEITIKDNNFTVNGNFIEYDSLQRVLKRELIKSGEPQPTIILKVTPDTKRGTLSDLEAIMRKLNVRKVNYTDLDDPK